jgi:hypothetical protein
MGESGAGPPGGSRAEPVELAQAGVRLWVGEVKRRGVVRSASVVTGLTAAACAELWMPVLAGASVTGVAGVVAGLGGNLLATTVERAWDRLRGEQRETVSREDLRAVVGEALAETLSADRARRVALSQEMAKLVRGVGAVDVALAEAGDDQQLRLALERGLGELARSMAEFGGALLEEMQAGRARVDEVAAQERAHHQSLVQLIEAVLARLPKPALAPASPAAQAAGDAAGQEAAAAAGPGVACRTRAWRRWARRMPWRGSSMACGS